MKKFARLASVAAMAAVACLPLVSTGTASAASNQSRYAENTGWVSVDGNLIWYNRSVQVGGTLSVQASDCGAVVYTGYDGSNNIVARQQRGYICGPASLGHGFTLDASTVYGGIRTVLIDIWDANDSYGSGAKLRGRIQCDRNYNNTGPFCRITIYPS